jgi:pimeloyl-ACP methyl ester carboxylesterase
MPFYERGEARIYYEEQGDGFPLLLIAPGGMNSAIAFWSRMPFNPIEALASDFRVIAMDQRNCGQSSGPLDAGDPWGSYVDDQVGLLDHLGVEGYLALGCCIGCSYLLGQIQRHPGRMVAGVLEQPIGLVDTNHQTFQDGIWRPWAEALAARRDDVTSEQVDAFGNAMWGGDFVFSVDRAFLSTVQTPLLILEGNDMAHPQSISREVASLLPNAEYLERWRRPEDVPGAVERVRAFLKSHASSPAGR